MKAVPGYVPVFAGAMMCHVQINVQCELGMRMDECKTGDRINE